MASVVMMKNPQSGVTKKGFFGFSWTYLLFGGFVPLIRGELGVGILHIILTLATFGIWQIVFAFMYNKQYTSRLIKAGFKFADRPEINAAAAKAIGVDPFISTLIS